MKLEFEYQKLKGKIVEMFGSCGRFADELGISNVTVSNKLTGKSRFSQEDVISWSEALSIPLCDAGQYFFVQKVKSD